MANSEAGVTVGELADQLMVAVACQRVAGWSWVEVAAYHGWPSERAAREWVGRQLASTAAMFRSAEEQANRPTTVFPPPRPQVGKGGKTVGKHRGGNLSQSAPPLKGGA